MIPKFNEEFYQLDPHSKFIKYVCPTKVENDIQLMDYHDYMKSVDVITDSDLKVFYNLLRIPQRFSKEKLFSLFTMFEQSKGAEKFENNNLAMDCMEMIGNYRTELE